MSWNEKAEDALRDLWDKGLTAAACAVKLAPILGRKCTKNMVIGRVRDLRLPKRRPGPSKKNIRSRSITPTDTIDAVLSLETDACKYPTGDPQHPGFAFCGKPALPNRPYCADHHALCHEKKS